MGQRRELGHMKKKLTTVLIIIGLLVIALISNYYSNSQGTDMTYPSFLDAVNNDTIETVILTDNSNTFKAYLKDDNKTPYIVPNPKTEDFTEYLLTNGVNVKYSDDNISTKALQVLLVVFIGIGVFLFVKKDSSSGFNINNVKKKSHKTNITLDNVAGNAEAKLMVQDIISFIKEPEKYSQVGARMPKGLLLYGPPGTGKTLMAKAIAGEADVPFYAMSGSDFVQMYVGVGASRIRSLFNKAKKNERAVIFIDEIDAIGKKRGRSVSASNDERDQTLNALLTEMSGFNDNQGIIVIGATNRLDTLDEALLRPGRFDRQLEIGLPDVNARKKILSLYGNQKPLSDDVDINELAKSTVYFSGAMLENLMNEAAINAANDSSKVINKAHIDTAFYTVIAGSPKLDRTYITEKERKVTAYHEAGHALATTLLQPDTHISKVTIIPSVKGAGGFNLSIPKDTMYQTNSQILSSIKVLLAGRAAEELIYGENEITTGASNDIEKASTLLFNYMNKYGMDKDMGMFSTAVLDDGYDNEVIKKCRTQMKELYNETLTLVKEHRELLEKITMILLEKESIDGNDIKELCA